MTTQQVRFLPPPWVFVLTGILFNILSAVITHYFIGLNNDKIISINTNINNQQVLIDSLWQSKTEVERKQEFYILFLTTAGKVDSMADQVFLEFKKHLNELISNHDLNQFDQKISSLSGELATSNNQTILQLLLEIGRQSQQKIITSINDTYFDILDLESQKAPVEKSNARLYSIAIFLQVIGLILVLARDLSRR